MNGNGGSLRAAQHLYFTRWSQYDETKGKWFLYQGLG